MSTDSQQPQAPAFYATEQGPVPVLTAEQAARAAAGIPQPAASQINAPRLLAPSPSDAIQPRRSLFTDDHSSWAAKLSIDGYTFYIRELSKEAREREARFAEETAAKMGMPVAEFLNTKAFVREDQGRTYLEEQAKLYADLISDALISWTAPVPVSRERIEKLQPDVKRNLADFIVAFSKYGTSEQEFFRSRFGPGV